MNDSLRPLWLIGPQLLTGKILAERACNLGFNALIHTEACPGIFWIQQVKTLEEAERSAADALFWQSTWRETHLDRDLTQVESVQKELEGLENVLKTRQRLFFYVPGLESDGIFQELSLSAKKQTTLVFSAVAGEPFQDSLGPHPLWKRVHPSYMPLLNGGMLEHGEGFWPTLPFELFERLATRLQGNLNRGFITMSPTLPAGYGFLHCSLWVCAQMQLEIKSPELIIEEWFNGHKTAFNYLRQGTQLRTLRTLILDLRHLSQLKSQDTLRIAAEGLISRLNLLAQTLPHETPELWDYAIYTLRDLRRLLLMALQNANIHFPSSEDHLDSFWTRQMATKISIQPRPYSGKPNTRMHSIYLENT